VRRNRGEARPGRRAHILPAASPPWIERAFALALRCKEGGESEQAKQLYIRILERQPGNAPALYNLATIARESGDRELALGLSARAVNLCPGRAEFHSAHAIDLEAAGQRDRAVSEYQAALRLDANCVDALYNYGNTLKEQGSFTEAITCFHKALARKPDHSFARNNLGNAYLVSGRLDEAAACFEKGFEQQPDSFMALLNLAIVLHLQGHLERAETLLRRAIQLDPRQPIASSNLGDMLLSANRVGEAVACLEAAARHAPDLGELHINLGRSYAAQGRFDEALRCYKWALAVQPQSTLGHEIILFVFHYSPEFDPQALADEHRAWAERHAAPWLPPGKRHANKPDPERRLRVGYVSADLRQHPVAYFMAPVFAAHDPRQVDIVCYASGKPDSWTERIRPHTSLWRTTDGLGDAELANLIEQDQIDILVDLSGHTWGNRLLVFARKPAPVQVSWLGYFNTTGMQAMDYLIVDQHLAPLEEKAPFVEEPLRIPGCYLTYEIPDDAPPVAPAPCLDRGFITYGCFNNLSKIGLHVVSVWCEILRRNPEARLVMKNPGFADEASRKLYQDHFESCGIARERVDLLGRSPHKDLLQYYSQVDLALDPFPYNGGTTTCEALAMGVPVVAMRGDRFNSRQASTILYNAGLAELVTHSQAEYVEKAVELGQNFALLADLRNNMRTRLAASTLCDAEGFTRRLESAYRDIWRRWCSAQPSA
jgi:protein O-GlcNAc transferase